MSRVSVALPVYNEEHSIHATIESLLAQTRKPDEIVVGDGGSTDRTREILDGFISRGAPLRYVDNPARRVGAGRNRAVQAASNPLVACIDAGNTADPTWLETLTRALEGNDGEAIAVGRVIPRPETRFEDCVSRILYHYMLIPPADDKERSLRAAQGCDPLSSSCMAFPSSLWRDLGGYPEWLEAGEDKLFTRKFLTRGTKVLRCPDAIVRHHMRSSPLGLLRMSIRYGRGSGLSGQTVRRTFQLAARYAIAGTLLMGAVVVNSPALKLVPLGLLLAGGALRLYRQGYRPLLRTGGTLDPATILLTPIVLLSRDVGVLIGHTVGNMERILRPQARHRVREYMS